MSSGLIRQNKQKHLRGWTRGFQREYIPQRQTFWLVIAGKSTGGTNDTDNGAVPLRVPASHYTEPECTISRALAGTATPNGIHVVINVIDYICAFPAWTCQNVWREKGPHWSHYRSGLSVSVAGGGVAIVKEITGIDFYDMIHCNEDAQTWLDCTTMNKHSQTNHMDNVSKPRAEVTNYRQSNYCSYVIFGVVLFVQVLFFPSL